MYDEEEETFTFTWRVRNFSMCPVNLCNSISSPVFRIRNFGNSEWELRLYPKGQHTKDSIACYLCCKGLGTIQSTIKIKISWCISSFEKATENTFKLDDDWGYPDFILVKDIFNDSAKHLPNDTLTIKCTMKYNNLVKLNTTEIDRAEIKSGKCICKKNYLYLNQCCIETTIHVETKRVFWSIMSLPCNKELVFPVFSPVMEKPSFYVTFYKIAESPTIIKIKINKNGIYGGKLYIKCRLAVINIEKDVKYCAEGDFLFKTVDDVWKFPPFLKLSDLEKDGYFESTDGMLHLQFDFAFSVDGRMHHSEKQDWNPGFLPAKSQLPVKLFELTTDDEQSIATIKAGDHTFKVHRSLLESKSEVFLKMFESDMKEKQTGVVDIADVDPHIVAQMLEFLYFNTVDDLSQIDAAKLYAFGDKYQIKSLVSHCSSILVSLLSMSNVCDILDFADLHRDQRLLKYAQDFVTIHFDSILVSKEWEEFMERSGTLAAKVLHKILII